MWQETQAEREVIMPAMNAGAAVTSNPTLGLAVIMNPFSGPKGSPFDKDAAGNNSTGALNTGIGFGLNHVFGRYAADIPKTGFNDLYTPGVTKPDLTAATDARLTCIGGGKSTATVNGEAPTVPYNAQPLLAFGNGASRDAGAGPAFTGFDLKSVTATALTANGAVIAGTWVNRAGESLLSGESAFGSNTVASPAIA